MERWRLIPGFLRPDELEGLAALARASDGWAGGRQDGGYEKLVMDAASPPPEVGPALARMVAALEHPPLVQSDLYLIRYALGASIRPHVDPPLLDGCVHLRLNAVVQQADAGGTLLLDGAAVPLRTGDAVIFRPDIVRHEVTAITRGSRLLLSAGCNVSPR